MRATWIQQRRAGRAAASPEARAATASALAAVAAWAVVCAPLAAGSALWFRDLLIYTYPQKLYALSRLRHGALPLWCDVWGTGRPFFGLVQPGALDPLNALLLAPGSLGPDLYNLSHLLVAMLGARAWLRRLGDDPWPAALGGALFGLSGYLVSMAATNGTYAWGVSFVPWALAALAGGGASSGARSFAGHAVGVALALSLAVLSGDPMAAMLAGLAGLAQCAGAETAAARWRGVALLACGASLAGALCAVQLLPAVEVARSYRSQGVTLYDAETFSLHPLRLLEVLVPDALGAPYHPEWTAPRLYTRTSQPLLPFAIGIHQGTALLPLALAALRRRARVDRALWGLAVFGAALALGRFTPVWPWCFAHVPGLRMFRHPEKYWFLATLALAALAARGVPVALAHRRASALAAALVALAYTVALWVLLGTGLDRAAPTVPAALAQGAGLGVAYALAFWVSSYAERSTSLGAARAAPWAVLAWELWRSASGLMPWTSSAAVTATPPLVAAIARDRGGDARGARVFRSMTLGVAAYEVGAREAVGSLAPNVGSAQGVGHLDAYDAIRAQRVPWMRREVVATPAALLRWWGVEYAVWSTGVPLPEGLRPVATATSLGVRLLRVEGAAPRVYLARDAVTVRGWREALDVARSPGFVAGEGATVEGPARRARGRCAVRAYAPERREVACESDAPAWLVVGETYDPVWKATVDGAPVATARGNEMYTAIPVPAGRSTVRMEVRPWGLRAGAAVSLTALAVCATLLAWSRRGARATAA